MSGSVSDWMTVREIGIDAGHRVPDHGSKCRNVHGHRYRVRAVVKGDLHATGEQTGMTLDFGFIKEIMMEHIDAPCDHGMIMSMHDPLLEQFMPFGSKPPGAFQLLGVTDADYLYLAEGAFGKLYVIPFTPTAENLARHWYARMKKPVHERSDGMARLAQVIVWETPNCMAAYPAGSD